ncbi:hypothetical protein [Streptomyces sp. NPDC018045]|uniref:hypothetical protein n=1 Tax=Streptomyces sp. NPDC018045 TaxID=3365037 RepID=UPI00379521F6
MSSSTTVRTARRRTLRVAAAALTAAAALSLTACSGSDSAGTKPAAQTNMGKTAAESGGTGPSAGARGSGAEADSKAGSGGGAGSKAGSGTGAESKAGAADKQPGGGRSGAAEKSSPVRTQALPDGSKAEIHKLGAQHYRAEIVNDGSVLATLEANQRDAGLDANGMYVVLTLDGKAHAWMGGEHQGPGTFALAGGWTAKVTKLGELRYRAQILGRKGSVDATLEANQHDTGTEANGVHIVLSAGGVISAHQ